MSREQDLGSVGISPAEKPSPSLANEPATPSERLAAKSDKWGEATRLEARARQLRAEIREINRAEAVAKLRRLPAHQRAVLGSVVGDHLSWDEGGYAFSFQTLAHWSGLSRAQVSRACKALRRLGFLSFHRGLFTEDGEVAGSGYALTRAGEQWWSAREAAPEGVATTPASDGEVRDAHSAPNDRTQDHPPGGHSHEG